MSAAPADLERRASFIRANTALQAPPHVPEVQLHLAHEALDLWHATEEELERQGLPPPFWAFAWAGGQALARYVLDTPAEVAGRDVLDLASGSGLVGIAAMKAGAARMLCADIDPFAVAATHLNAAQNAVTVTTTDADLIGQPLAAKVILVGDLFYDRDIAVRLMGWLEELKGLGRRVLIGDPGRAYLPRERLVHLATYEVAVSRALEDADVKRTQVWTLA